MTCLANKILIPIASICGLIFALLVIDNNREYIWLAIVVALLSYLFLAISFRLKTSNTYIIIRQGLLWKTVRFADVVCLGYSLDHYKGHPIHFLELVYKNNVGENIKVTVRLSWYTQKSLHRFFSLIFRELPLVAITAPFSNYLKYDLDVKHGNQISILPPAKKEWDIKLERYRLRPNFTETDLFLMSFFFILLILFDRQVIQDVVAFNYFLAYVPTIGIVLLVFEFLFFVGMIISIFHFFSSGKRGVYTQKTMYAFGILMVVLVGILSSIYILVQPSSMNESVDWIYMAIALQNLIYGLVLFFTFRFRAAKTAISNSEIDIGEVASGMITLFLFFLYSKIFHNLPWPFVFSGGIFYVTMANAFVKKLYALFHFKPRHISMSTPSIDNAIEITLEKIWGSHVRIIAYLLILLLLFAIILIGNISN